VLKRLLFIALTFYGSFSFAQAPTAAIVPPAGTICVNQPVIFNSTTTNTPTAYSWSINPAAGANILLSSNQPSVGVNFTLAGVYSVSLTVSNASGTVTASKNVTVNVTPVALFSASLTNIGFPNELDLTNFSTNATNYLWTFSETASTNTVANVIHTYSASGAYSVMLVASNTNGCSDTSTYKFYIADSSGITLPNIFTPNGDGVNDIFKPVARGISSLKVSVYTRFGTFVYGWETINGFWDGYTTSGILCESGTYFYVLEANGFDGKTYKLKSFLTLLRN
jgi:gliding motility-associated-like protein